MASASANQFVVGPAPELRGEASGEGSPIVLCHGITATRRYVVQGSRVLERAGHRVVSYHARGHGASVAAHPGMAAGAAGSVLRFPRERIGLDRHRQALAQALRETPASRPFGALEELRGLQVPALVVASHDEADPGHPYAVAVA